METVRDILYSLILRNTRLWSMRIWYYSYYVTNEEFMEEIARYECVYNRNSKNFKDKNKKANSWEKVGEKYNLPCLFMNVFRIQNRCFLRFWSWRCRRYRTKRRNKNFLLDAHYVICFDFLASTTRVYILHFRWTKGMATVGSAIVCDYMETVLFAIVDRLRSYENQPLVFQCNDNCICIGNSMICSDIWHKYQEWYFKIVLHNFTTR